MQSNHSRRLRTRYIENITFIKSILIFIFILWWCVPLLKAVNIYSYTDGEGRTIVVDSIDKVPLQYRDQVKVGSIRAYEKTPVKINDNLHKSISTSNVTNSANYDLKHEAIAPILCKSGGDLVLEGPAPEIALATEPAWASASVWLTKLEQIQEVGNKIIILARVFSVRDSRLSYLRLEALQKLEDVRSYESMNWDRASDWVSQARVLTDRYRQIFYTIGQWLSKGGQTLLQELPPLLSQTRNALDHLHKILPEPLMIEIPISSSSTIKP